MKYAIAMFAVLALSACSSTPLPLAPPPIVPGIPGQHWQLCLRLVEAQVQEVILSDPQAAQLTTAQELACIRMRATAECGFAFEKIASDDTSGTVLVGEWCPADFKTSMDRFVPSRCGDDPGEYVDEMVTQVTDGMARRIHQALTSSRRGN